MHWPTSSCFAPNFSLGGFLMSRRLLFARSVIAALSALAILSSYCVRRAAAADENRPIRALLVCGGGSHDYEHQKDAVANGIMARANVEVTIAYDPSGVNNVVNPIYEKDDYAKGYDVIIHDICSGQVKDLDLIKRVLKPHQDGLPAVVLHAGMHAFRSEGWNAKATNITPWFELTGLPTTSHGPRKPIAIRFTDPTSPITKGLEDWTTIGEELYNNPRGGLLDTAHELARGKQTITDKDTGKKVTNDNVVVWTNLYKGKTRVFATTIGHTNETVKDPRYLDLITRGLLWSVDKLDDAHLKPFKKAADETTSTDK
jgi:type 1 glutamine amidotransferase